MVKFLISIRIKLQVCLLEIVNARTEMMLAIYS